MATLNKKQQRALADWMNFLSECLDAKITMLHAGMTEIEIAALRASLTKSSAALLKESCHISTALDGMAEY